MSTIIFNERISEIGKTLVEKEKLRKKLEEEIFKKLIYQLSFIFVVLLPIVLTFTEIVDIDDILDQLLNSLNYVIEKSTSFIRVFVVPQFYMKMKEIMLYVRSIKLPSINLPTFNIGSMTKIRLPDISSLSFVFNNIYANAADFVYETIDSSILIPYNRFLLIMAKVYTIIKIMAIVSPFILAIICLIYYIYKKRKLINEKIEHLYEKCILHLEERKEKFIALDHLKVYLKEKDDKMI